MPLKILARNYRTEDTEALASIYYHTIHKINIQHYTEEQAVMKNTCYKKFALIASLEAESQPLPPSLVKS